MLDPLTSNQTLQKPLVPKTPSIPRLTTSGNKTVTQRTIKHDANRSKIFSVSETTTTRHSAGIALRHEDTNTTTLNMESRYYSANGRSWIEPIQKCTDHFPAPSQCTGARDTETAFNTKGLALVRLSNGPWSENDSTIGRHSAYFRLKHNQALFHQVNRI